MILCVTLNPVLDWTFHIDQFQQTYRTEARELHRYAGGKGNNAARVLKDLGVEAAAFNALGGENGQALLNLLEKDGLNLQAVWVAAETRLAVNLIDRCGEQRAVFAPPQPWSPQDPAAVWAAFESLLPQVDIICICGSSPDPAATPLFFEMVNAANRRGLLTILDSYGPGLAAGLRAAPTVLKINQQEAEGYVGDSLSDEKHLQQGLRDLQTRSGSAQVIITRGSLGAVMVAQDGSFYQAQPLALPVLNTIGCGDAFTAGLAMGLLHGLPDWQCFRLGTAAAGANTLTWQPGKVDPAEVSRLIGEVNILPLRAD